VVGLGTAVVLTVLRPSVLGAAAIVPLTNPAVFCVPAGSLACWVGTVLGPPDRSPGMSFDEVQVRAAVGDPATRSGACMTRPRVGLVLPSVQVVTEPLFARLAGAEIDVLGTRVALQGTAIADLEAMEAELPRAVDDLAAARVDLLVSCCTASGALRGREADERACAKATARTGIPMTTTMLSIVERLRDLGARRLTVVTPYPPALDAVEHCYPRDNGFTVLAAAGRAPARRTLRSWRCERGIRTATPCC
jgi:hypothetical protein